MLFGVDSGLFAAVDTEFGQDRADVVVDRSRAEAQSGGDLGVAMTGGEQVEDLALAAGEAVRVGAGGAVARVGGAAAQLGQALAGAAGRRAGAQAAEGRQCGLHRSHVAAELGDGRVVGAAAPGPFRRGALPVPADFQLVGRDWVADSDRRWEGTGAVNTSRPA